jgi:hypothetical protein
MEPRTKKMIGMMFIIFALAFLGAFLATRKVGFISLSFCFIALGAGLTKTANREMSN